MYVTISDVEPKDRLRISTDTLN